MAIISPDYYCHFICATECVSDNTQVMVSERLVIPIKHQLTQLKDFGLGESINFPIGLSSWGDPLSKG